MSYYQKYIKYKNKYLNLKNQIAGSNNENDEVCPICMAKLNCEPNEPDCEPHTVIATNCEPISHEFHESCLAQNCRSGRRPNECPMCRKDISELCNSIIPTLPPPPPQFSLNEYINVLTNLNANSNMEEIYNRSGNAREIIDKIHTIENLPEDNLFLRNVSNVFPENDIYNDIYNYNHFNILVNTLHLYQLYNQYILPLDTEYDNLPLRDAYDEVRSFPDWNLNIIIEKAIKNQDFENFNKIETFVVEPYKLSGKFFRTPTIIVNEPREPDEEDIDFANFKRNPLPTIMYDETDNDFYPKSTNEEINDYINNNEIVGYKIYDKVIYKSEFFRIINDLRSKNTITIPNFVSIIGKEAFQNSFIQQIIFSENSRLTTIQSYAFDGSLLTNINLDNCINLKKIGDNAFDGCSLTNIIIPNSVTKIGKKAFYINLDEDEYNPLSNINLNEVSIPRIFESSIERIFGDITNLTIQYT